MTWRRFLIASVFCFFMLAGPAVVFGQGTADKEFIYNDHGRRDPFGKLISPNGVILTPESDLSAADLTLEGIMADSDGNSIAIINSRVVKVKDAVGPFRVMKITTDTVVVQREEEVVTLILKKEE